MARGGSPELPAPPVTIVDPTHPRPLPAGPPPLEHRPWRRREVALLMLLVLVLVSAWTTSARLRQESERQRLLDDVRLSASLLAGSSISVDGRVLRVLVLVVGDDDTDVALTSLEASGDWQLRGRAPAEVVRGSAVTVTLLHDVDCAGPVQAPRELAVRTTVAGASRRTVLPVVREPGDEVADPAAICGRLDAAEALQLSRSVVHGESAGTVVTLRLVNAGLDPLVVRGASLGGFAVRARRAWPVLPGRAPGRLADVTLPVQGQVLDLVLQDCGAARAVLDTAAQRGAVSPLRLLVDGRGGAASVPLEVRGLVYFLDAQWQVGCT